MNNLTLYGRNPFDLIDRMFASDDIFEPRFRSPVIDISEEKDRYVLEAELPGLSDKDVTLELKDSVLTLSTAKESDSGEKKDRHEWIRRERRSFRFSRSFSLPEDADPERIEAKFKDGLLKVEIYRKAETAPRIVPVKVA